MASVVTTGPANEGKADAGAKHPQRRPKSGNSELFNDLLSAANQLSVAERTRLVKSLAGQLGLMTVGGQALIGGAAAAGPAKQGRKQPGKPEGGPVVRSNPLKGTKFWVDKEAAKATMLKAREDAGGAQLDSKHPAVIAYAIALKAYKDEQAKLKPVDPAKQNQSGSQPSKKAGAKRTAERSPERGNYITRASSIAKRLTGSSRDPSKMETEG